MDRSPRAWQGVATVVVTSRSCCKKRAPNVHACRRGLAMLQTGVPGVVGQYCWPIPNSGFGGVVLGRGICATPAVDVIYESGSLVRCVDRSRIASCREDQTWCCIGDMSVTMRLDSVGSHWSKLVRVILVHILLELSTHRCCPRRPSRAHPLIQIIISDILSHTL